MAEQAAAVHSNALTLSESVIKLQVGKTLPDRPEIIFTHTLIMQTPAFLTDTPHPPFATLKAPIIKELVIFLELFHCLFAGERWQRECICWIFTSQTCLAAVETTGGKKAASHDLLALPKLHLAMVGGKSVVGGSAWEPLTYTNSAFRASTSSQMSAAPLSKEVHNFSARCFQTTAQMSHSKDCSVCVFF